MVDTILTVPMCFLCNVSPDIEDSTHDVKVKALLFGLGEYITLFVTQVLSLPVVFMS